MCQDIDIPSKIIKLNKDIIVPTISEYFNSCKGEFPDDLKHAGIFLVHKKKSKTDKTNYTPVSILSKFSNLYEKLMYKKLYLHFETTLLSGEYGFK